MKRIEGYIFLCTREGMPPEDTIAWRQNEKKRSFEIFSSKEEAEKESQENVILKEDFVIRKVSLGFLEDQEKKWKRYTIFLNGAESVTIRADHYNMKEDRLIFYDFEGKPTSLFFFNQIHGFAQIEP